MNSYYSNIYWHFTGSPKGLEWEKIFCPKDILKHGKPKNEDESVSILGSIIRSSCLQAKARERIDTKFYSDPFCCVTDIPIQNLKDHKKYYGNIVIGFKHMNIHKQFNPVIYLSKSLLPVRSARYEELPDERIALSMKRIKNKDRFYKNSPLHYLLYGLHVDETKLGSFLFHHFKVTLFSENADNTFYREREWRKIGNFEFGINDIAAIIVSEANLKKSQKILLENKINDVPVLTWEILDRM